MAHTFHRQRLKCSFFQRTKPNPVFSISQAIDLAASKTIPDDNPAVRVARIVFVSGLRDFARNPREGRGRCSGQRDPGRAAFDLWGLMLVHQI